MGQQRLELDDATAARLTDGMVAGDSQALADLYHARFDWMVGVLRGALRRRGVGNGPRFPIESSESSGSSGSGGSSRPGVPGVSDLRSRRASSDEAFILDCVQDAWLRVARRPVRCAHLGALEAWLRRVALTAALDRLRSDTARRVRELDAESRAGRPRSASTESPRSDDVLEAMETIDALRAAVDGADAEARGLLLLRYRAGLTVVQIAAAVGLGTAAVDSRLRRAVERLRNRVGETATEDGAEAGGDPGEDVRRIRSESRETNQRRR